MNPMKWKVFDVLKRTKYFNHKALWVIKKKDMKLYVNLNNNTWGLLLKFLNNKEENINFTIELEKKKNMPFLD